MRPHRPYPETGGHQLQCKHGAHGRDVIQLNYLGPQFKGLSYTHQAFAVLMPQEMEKTEDLNCLMRNEGMKACKA